MNTTSLFIFLASLIFGSVYSQGLLPQRNPSIGCNVVVGTACNGLNFACGDTNVGRISLCSNGKWDTYQNCANGTTCSLYAADYTKACVDNSLYATHPNNPTCAEYSVTSTTVSGALPTVYGKKPSSSTAAGGLSGGAVAGIVIGGLVVLGGLGAAIAFFIRKKPQQSLASLEGSTTTQ